MRLRVAIPAAVAALLACASTPLLTGAHAAPATTTPYPLRHAGQWLLDNYGRVEVDHGFNVVAKRPPYQPSATGFGEDDARFLAAHGFTAVRLGVLLEALEPAPGRFNEGYLNGIAATVQMLSRYGIRSLLDFHQDLFSKRYQGEGFPAWMAIDGGLPAAPPAGFPGNYFAMPALWRAFDNLWGNAPGPRKIGLRDEFARAWAHVAARFRGDAAVLGYDLLNEPFPGSDYLSCFPPRGCPSDDTTRLAPFMRASINAIHRVDPGHLTFYEPWLTFGYGAPTALGNFADGASGMSFHDYCLAAVGAPETPPTRTACNDMVEAPVIQHALQQSRRSGDALMLTEFGATSDVTELREILSLADAHAIPWLDWAYCACGDPTGSGRAESVVYDPRKPPVGSNVNRKVLDVLDEPYPRRVAGTPGTFLFDRTRDVFRFVYSTHPAGRWLQPGTTTDIWVGRQQFPRGYRVTVHGARVVSAPGTPVLSLLATPGVQTVVVTVRPPD